MLSNVDIVYKLKHILNTSPGCIIVLYFFTNGDRDSSLNYNHQQATLLETRHVKPILENQHMLTRRKTLTSYRN